MTTTASAASGIQIYNYTSGKTTTYTDKQVQYVCNNAVLQISDTPGILINGTALGPYEDIFKDFYGIKCTLNAAGTKLTISYNSTVIALTLGSTTAVVNGTKKTMSVAPVKIKYKSSGKEKILVPTRFVTETLGMSYTWDSSASKVSIVKKTNLIYNNNNINYTSSLGRITYDGNLIATNNIPVIQISNTAMIPAYNVLKKVLGFGYKFNEASNSITLTKGDITLVMTLGSTNAYVNGESIDCGTAPCLVNFTDYKKELVVVPAYFVAQVFSYDYAWNNTTKIAAFTSNEKIGVWKESVIYNIVNESDINNTSQISNLEEDIYKSIPAEIYEHLQSDSTADYIKEQVSLINQSSIYMNNTTSQVSYLTNIYKDNNVAYNSTETYHVSFSEPVYQVENLGFNENDLLTLRFPNTTCSSRFYNLSGSLITNIATDISSTKGCSEINLQLASKRLNYDIRFSEDNLSLIITVFPNYLTDIIFGKNEAGIEFLQLKALFPIDAEITASGDFIGIMFDDMVNLVGDYDITELNTNSLVSLALSTYDMNSLALFLGMTDSEANLHPETNDNEFTIYFTENKSAIDSNLGIKIYNYLDIPLPEGITIDQISDKDEYYNHRIILTLPGDHSEFYNQNKIINSCITVSNVNVSVNSNTTSITITTDVVQGYKIEEGNNSFKLKVGNPDEFYSKIVVLDAGHGGKDPGAIKNGTNEKDLNFKILNQYVAEYFKDSDIKVYFTRVTDTLINLYDRAAFPTEVGADFFISLHMNSNNTASVNGTGVYYSVNNTSKSESGLNSKILASTLAKNISDAINTKNNGALTANFVVIRETRVPAVLIELAFMSNASDYKKITTESVQKKAAKTIYDTIVTMFEAYPTNR